MNERLQALLDGGIIRDVQPRPVNDDLKATDHNKFAKNNLDLPEEPFTEGKVKEARSIWGSAE